MTPTEGGGRRSSLLAPLLAFGLAALFAAALFFTLDLAALRAALANARYEYLIMAAAFTVATLFVDSAKFVIFFQKIKPAYFWDSFRAGYFGFFIANTGLGQIGADAYRVALLRLHVGGAALGTQLVILVRGAGLAITLLIATVAVTLVGGASDGLNFSARDFASLAVAALAIVLVGVLLARLLMRRFALKIDLQAQRNWVMSWRTPVLIGLCALTDVFRFATIYAAMAATGISLDPATVVFITAMTTIVTLLPISFHGLGAREATLTGLMVLQLVDPAAASASAILSRLVMVLTAAPGGFFVDLRLRDRKRS